MFKRLIAPALVFGLAAIAPPVKAEGRLMACGKRAEIVAALQKRYGESAAGVGIAGENRVVELWSSAETGTWTLLMTRTDGVACMMASGEDWTTEKEALAGLGDPS